MSWLPAAPTTPTTRALLPGDVISSTVPLFIVAVGPHVGAIGTLSGIAASFPGALVLPEGSPYSAVEYPDLARFLAPLQGTTRVPVFSTPQWL